jgi:hypothetical protein
MVQSGSEGASSPRNGRDENSVPSHAPRVLEGTLKVSEHNPFVNPGTRGGAIPQSGSQLTDILSSLSPSKTGFSEFQPNCPSAMPSPLHRSHRQPPSNLLNRNGVRANVPNMSVNDHFFVTNEHIDVVACSLYDHIAMWTKRGMGDSGSNHNKLLSVIGKQFEDLQSQINSFGEKMDHSTTQNRNLGVQLDNLFEFIKKEIVVPMEAQTNKIMGMEQTIKELQQTMHDLQKSAERSTPQSGSTPFPLPNHRSQPSLTGYYDESGWESMLHHQQMSGYGETRRHGINNNNFYRPGYGGREGKDNGHPFSNTNPYKYSAGQVSGGFVQGYSPSDQHYGFNQGPSK